MIGIKQVLAGLAVAGFLAPGWAATGPPAAEIQDAVFAVVDGTVIGVDEFEGMLSAVIRQRFYHRRPPEDQLATLREEVTGRMVNKVLLFREAQRRGLQPEEEKVSAEVAAYEQRNNDRPQWRENREQVLPLLTQALKEQSMIAQLEAATRAVSPPSEEDLLAYYKAHPELFTEPERIRLSMVLLKVDPSSPSLAWEQALERAQDIVRKLANGASFAELARQHSDDGSARDGGDMGYRHRGMLPPSIESEIEKIPVGKISEPFRLLEGIAVFRVTERKPAQIRRLEEVRSNVAELWAREQGETQWLELRTRLRAVAKIEFIGNRQTDPITHSGALGSQAVR